MSRRHSLPRLLLALAAFVPALAHAQLYRAYLASYGSDANPCTLVAPCRLLPAAISAVAPNGEIWILDSANFNSTTVDVAKSVTVQAIPGQVGSIVAAGNAEGIVVEPGISLTMRNVSIASSAVAPGSEGIRMDNGTLVLENCVVSMISTPQVYPIGIAAGGTVSIHDCVFRGGFNGVSLGGNVVADISRSKFVGASDAALRITEIANGQNALVNVSDSSFFSNQYGIHAWGLQGTSSIKVTVTRSTFSGNLYGLYSDSQAAGASTLISLSYSEVAGNTTGLVNCCGGNTITSLGNNHVTANGTDVSGTITALPAK